MISQKAPNVEGLEIQTDLSTSSVIHVLGPNNLLTCFLRVEERHCWVGSYNPSLDHKWRRIVGPGRQSAGFFWFKIRQRSIK